MRRLIALLALLLTAACSNEIDTGGAGLVADAELKDPGDLTFAVVSHGAASDAFWTIVKNGALQAGRDLGVTVTYNGSDDPQVQAQYIDAEVNQGVDGLIVSMANPDALKASVQRAVSRGIPVITINSGQAESEEYGAITHVGQDEVVAGEAAGVQMKKDGVEKFLCVIHEAGNISLDQRCNGAAKGLGGEKVNLQVNINDLQGAESTIKAKLQSDPSIDAVLTLNASIATVAVQAKQDAKAEAEIATFDLSGQVARAISAGDVAFAVDQQPFDQGYLPVTFLYLYQTNRNEIGGGKPVLTGPAIVTKDNADLIADLAQQGTR